MARRSLSVKFHGEGVKLADAGNFLEEQRITGNK